MATIKGKWLFNEVLNPPEESFFAGQGDVTFFVSNGTEYTCIYGYPEPNNYLIVYGHGADFPYGSNGEHAWQNEAYRTIDFGETEQAVDDTFYEWLTANATKVLETIADKLAAIAENEQRVYDAGKKAEYDAFWDAYQNYGKQTYYKYSFAGRGWTADTFKPKYDIKVSSATNMFQEFGDGEKCDLVEILKNQGVVLDTSNCTNLGTGFYGTSFTHIPKIDMSCSNARKDSLGYLFQQSKLLETIDEFILKDDGSQLLTSTFGSCQKLKNIKFGGVIGENLDMHWSPLTVDSMKSVISCLKDYSGTSNELINKLTFSEDCWAALEADSTAPDGNTWREYVATLGWLT